jgi:release factor glutamine methyltransferase
MKALDLVRDAAARIGGDTPRLDAEVIVAHAFGVTRDVLLLDNPLIDRPEAAAELISRRVAGEPVAYITGRQEFWSLDLCVTPDVLIPRADTETLIAEALSLFQAQAPQRILDLGTGSGALILAALSEWRQADGIATDVSPAALAVAGQNAERLGLADRCGLVVADWADGIAGPFDLVLSNPPYIATGEPLGPGVAEFEPHGALFAGDDGLQAYRRILPALPRLLAAGGQAVVEIGWQQAAAVQALAEASGLASRVVHDLAGRERAIGLHRM